ncbi:T9SS type A sorting domain-containing protein [candidate division KSB1 bacterium]|nr:T9SS type A sorting domain-containing protein [candidate division KSB1 bacterium]
MKMLWLTLLMIASLGAEAFATTSGKRTPAEWEPQAGLIINWQDSLYKSRRQEIQALMTEIVQDQGRVYIVTSDKSAARDSLEKRYGIPVRNCQFIEDSYSYPWVRDYMPQSFYSAFTSSPNLMYWLRSYDYPANPMARSAIKVANAIGYPMQASDSPPFRLAGGNFMTDGMGTGFSFDKVVSDNQGVDVHRVIRELNGIHRYILLPTPLNIFPPHVDMIMKMIDEETIAILDVVNNSFLKKQIEKSFHHIENNYLNVYDRPYRFVWIPSRKLVPKESYIEAYTNFFFFNSICFFPIFREPADDQLALKIMQEALPGHILMPIDCLDLIPYSGMIHCLTKEVGVPNSILIKHPRLFDKVIEPVRRVSGKHRFFVQKRANGYLVTAEIYAAHGRISANLDYLYNNQRFSIPMTNHSNKLYSAQLPYFAPGSVINYRIVATAQNGGRSTAPAAGYYEFTVIDGDPCATQNYQGGKRKGLRIPRGLFANHAQDYSSTVNVAIEPDVLFRESHVHLQAPNIHYSAPVGSSDPLFISNTDMSVSTRYLDLPKMLIGQTAFPDPQQMDTSHLAADVCSMEPIENWQLAAGVQVELSSHETIEIGYPALAGKVDAMKCDKSTLLSIESFKDILVHQGIGILPTILEDPGYVVLKSQNGAVRFNPASTTSVMQMNIAGGLMVAAYETLMRNADISLSSKSWLHVQAKELKIKGTNINLSDVVQEETTIPLNFEAWKFKVEPTGEAFPFAIRTSKFCQLLFGKESSGEHVIIQATKHINPVPQQKINTIANTSIPVHVNLSATQLDLQDSHLAIGQNESLKISARQIRFSHNAMIKSEENSNIEITAMTTAESKAHAQIFEELQQPKSRHKDTPSLVKTKSKIQEAEIQPVIDSTLQTEPTTYELSAFPNPFNPTTTLAYTLDTAGYVEIQVFDLLGRLVNTLVNDHLSAGSHQVVWNATTHASGLYFVRMIHRSEQTNKIDTQLCKINLLK